MPDNAYDRLADLEKQVASLRELVSQLLAREGRLGEPRQTRLAIIAEDPDEDADPPFPPEEDNPDTYWIKFVDGAFNDDVGDEGETLTDRSEDAKVKAHHIAQEKAPYFEAGELIAVFRHNGRWWFETDKSKPDFAWGYLTSALARGGSASMIVCKFGAGDVPVTTPLQITIWDTLLNDGEESYAINTRVQARYSKRDHRWILISANCDPEPEEENLPQEPE